MGPGARTQRPVRSDASLGVGLGLLLQQLGKLRGHSQIATTERYAHLADDPIRQANERIGVSRA